MSLFLGSAHILVHRAHLGKEEYFSGGQISIFEEFGRWKIIPLYTTIASLSLVWPSSS